MGTGIAAKAPPDGYTMVIVAAAYAAGASLYRNLPYDPIRDLAPVSRLAEGPLVLVVHPSLPARSVKELTALAKARPGELNAGNSGTGSLPHLTAELFATMSGVKLVHVPYKGPGAALIDVMSGQVPLYFMNVLGAMPLVKAGKLRALGVSSAERSPIAPELPTIAETGLRGFDMTNWYGLLVPAATPKDVVAKLHQEVVRIMTLPESRQLMAAGGMTVIASTPQQFSEFLKHRDGQIRACHSCGRSQTRIGSGFPSIEGGTMSSLDLRNSGLHDLFAPTPASSVSPEGWCFTEGPGVARRRAALQRHSEQPYRRAGAVCRKARSSPPTPQDSRTASRWIAKAAILAAEHGGRRVSRVADDGARTVLAEQFEGKRLNSPNDIVVKSDGSIYFTDPPYAVQPSTPGMARPEGWWKAPIPGKELTVHGVYRLRPDGGLHLLAEDFALPNGLAFSPDESILYIDDSAHKHIRAFDVRADGGLTNSRILLDMASSDPGVPDGMKVDLQGNVFCTGPGGVWVCRADGTLLGRIILPELPANLAWGEDGSVLFLRRVPAFTGCKPRRAARCWVDHAKAGKHGSVTW